MPVTPAKPTSKKARLAQATLSFAANVAPPAAIQFATARCGGRWPTLATVANFAPDTFGISRIDEAKASAEAAHLSMLRPLLPTRDGHSDRQGGQISAPLIAPGGSKACPLCGIGGIGDGGPANHWKQCSRIMCAKHPMPCFALLASPRTALSLTPNVCLPACRWCEIEKKRAKMANQLRSSPIIEKSYGLDASEQKLQLERKNKLIG